VEPPKIPTPSAPLDDSPSSSLERNIRPSEVTQLLRQKSSESVDVKNRHRKNSDKAEDYIGKRVTKSDSLKSTDSPTGSLGKNLGTSPTGSLSKLAGRTNNDSPTGSLGKNSHKANESAGSKESLTGIADISQRV
jgi:hypothetical protein